MFIIPTSFEATQRLCREPDIAKNIETDNEVYFEPKKDERIKVTGWYRFDTHDFIIGTPDGWREEKETACLWIRYDNGKSFCIYMDDNELNDVIHSLSKIRDEKKRATK